MAELGQRAASGYTLVLPRGWCRIPLRQGTSAAIRQLLNERFSQLPRDTVAPYRIEIERRLKEQVTQARRNGGVDLYFPVEITDSGPVPASFVVSEVFLPVPETAGDDGALMVVAALAAEGAKVVQVDGATGARSEETVEGDPAAELTYGSRRVKYLLPVPGTPGRWLAVVFATPGAADPAGTLAGLLTDLFDAIMLTFRWTEANGS
jgi:hypothetical protein